MFALRVSFSFPRLRFLMYAFDDYFHQIKETLRFVDDSCFRRFGLRGSVGRYIRGLALFDCENVNQPIISKCIKEKKTGD